MRSIRALQAFYFFNFGALGALAPFLPLLLSHRGLSALQISWVMVLIPLSNLLVPPLWGVAADAWRARLALLRLACVGSGASVLLLWPQWELLGSLLAVAGFSLFRAPLTSLADATTYAIMDQPNADFSRVRVWGSAGFALMALGVGAVEGSRHPALLLAVTGAAYLVSALCTLPLSGATRGRERGLLGEARVLLGRAPVLLFLLANACYYLGHATYDAFFALYAKQLGHGDAFVGGAWATGVAIEIVVMLLAPRFIHRVRSGRLLMLCALIAALRWILIAQVSAPGPLIAIQGLHGFTFGLWYLSMVKHVQAMAPDRLRTSLQSVAIACMGLGMVLGYLTGGALLDSLGGEVLFRVAAVAALAAWTLYGMAARRDRPPAVDA